MPVIWHQSLLKFTELYQSINYWPLRCIFCWIKKRNKGFNIKKESLFDKPRGSESFIRIIKNKNNFNGFGEVMAHIFYEYFILSLLLFLIWTSYPSSILFFTWLKDWSTEISVILRSSLKTCRANDI